MAEAAISVMLRISAHNNNQLNTNLDIREKNKKPLSLRPYNDMLHQQLFPPDIINPQRAHSVLISLVCFVSFFKNTLMFTDHCNRLPRVQLYLMISSFTDVSNNLNYNTQLHYGTIACVKCLLLSRDAVRNDKV